MISWPAQLRAQVTATWIGGAGSGYNTAANWDIGIVPLNGGGNTYNVVIPSGVTVTFDVDAPSEVSDFNLATSANFTVPGGHSLTVLDDAQISSFVTADSEGAVFQATGAGTAFGATGGRAHASNQGTVRIGATSFTNASAGDFVQFSAEGENSLLDLSSLQSYTDTPHHNSTRTVSATNNGVIDLSNVGTITKTNAGTIRFHMASEGNINLDGLTTISGSTLFDIDNLSYELPNLTSATELQVDLANGSVFRANDMTDFVGGVILFDGDNPGTFEADSLNNFTGSRVSLAAGQQLDVIPTGLSAIDSARISVRGQAQFGTAEVSATSFTNASAGDFVQFSAEGENSLLDLSSLQSYTDTPHHNSTRTVSATNNGVIDLSNVGTITKTNVGTLRFRAESGGQLLFGNFNVTGNVQFQADGSESVIDIAGSVNLSSPSSLALTDAALMNVGGDLLYNYTNEASWNLDDGIVSIAGPARHFLEVGGADLGVDGATSGNFGIGQLIVGTDVEASVVTLIDILDNHTGSPATEALYLYGLGGPDGLLVLGGSTLVIGNINTYALLDGEMVLLNGLFPANVTTIPFDQGFLTIPEPSSVVLMVLGIAGCLGLRYRRVRRRQGKGA